MRRCGVSVCLSVCQERQHLLCPLPPWVRRIRVFAPLASTLGADASGAKNKAHWNWQPKPVKWSPWQQVEGTGGDDTSLPSSPCPERLGCWFCWSACFLTGSPSLSLSLPFLSFVHTLSLYSSSSSPSLMCLLGTFQTNRQRLVCFYWRLLYILISLLYSFPTTTSFPPHSTCLFSIVVLSSELATHQLPHLPNLTLICSNQPSQLL